MPPIHHKTPEPIGAAFDENIFVQVICDGIHIHTSAIRLLYKLFGADGVSFGNDTGIGISLGLLIGLAVGTCIKKENCGDDNDKE